MKAGVCRFCGCSEFDACLIANGLEPEGCAWIDRARTVCSACTAAVKAEALHLLALRGAGYRIDRAWLQAFHVGFVVGWFRLDRHSVHGRNPFELADKRVRGRDFTYFEAWALGRRAGAEASRSYIDRCGPLENVPRPSVLVVKATR